MKKICFAMFACLCFSACNGDGKVDEEKLDKAGEKLQSTVQKGVDTVGAKLKKLKKKLDANSSD